MAEEVPQIETIDRAEEAVVFDELDENESEDESSENESSTAASEGENVEEEAEEGEPASTFESTQIERQSDIEQSKECRLQAERRLVANNAPAAPISKTPLICSRDIVVRSSSLLLIKFDQMVSLHSGTTSNIQEQPLRSKKTKKFCAFLYEI